MSLWYCKEENAPKDAEVSNTQCFSLICFLPLFLPPHFKHNRAGHVPHKESDIWVLCKALGHNLPGPVFKASQFRHTSQLCHLKQDKTHFHSLLTGGNVASNREGVAFIIRGPDTDEVLGKGGQRPQDGGCCSARNLNLQKRRRRRS